MLAKVQYPGPEGENEQFDAEVPEPPPPSHIFTNPDDGTEIQAILVKSDDLIAIYRAAPAGGYQA